MSGIVNSTGARSGVIGTTVGTPSGGKTVNVKEFTTMTRVSLPEQTTYDFFDTTYTQVMANSKIRVDVYLPGYTARAGTMGFEIVYDGTTHPGVGSYGGGSPFKIIFLVYFDGASSTGGKTFKVRWNAQSGNHLPFTIWNPNQTEDGRYDSSGSRSTCIVTEYDGTTFN